jgi:hypothetical protein
MSRVLWLLAALVALPATPSPAAERLDPISPAGGFAVERALGCGSLDTKAPQYYFWTGTVHARRAGEPDRLLFNVQGVNPRACRMVDDARRGAGYQAAARELMLYLDPASGELHGICYEATDTDTIRHVVVGTDGRVRREEPIAVKHGPSVHDCMITAQYVLVLDLPVTFSLLGALLAALVVGAPLYVSAMRQALDAVDPRYEAVSATLGVGPWRTFWRITLPLSAPGLAAGAVKG